ncbi:MAG: YjfB family protein [Polyangiaceae bacterium]
MTSAVHSRMESSNVSNVGSLAQSVQLQAAQIRLARKQMDAQGEAALELIQSVTPVSSDPNLGKLVDVKA